MSIDPLKSGSLPQADAGRSGQVAGGHAVRRDAPGAGEPAETGRRDSIEVSVEARALAEGREPGGPDGLSPERLREVLQRLESGFYDRADVLDQVARRAADDLRGA